MKLTSLLTATLATTVLAACPPPSSGPGPSGPVVRDHRDDPPPPPPSEPSGPVWNSNGWTLLGSSTVDGARDRDVIHVGTLAGRFDLLTMVVLDSDMELKDFTVLFANGERFEPHTQHFFREGQRTRQIDLPQKNRQIKDIEIAYANLPGGGRARVEIYGKNVGDQGKPVGENHPRPDQDQPPPPPPSGPAFDPAGWSLVGSGTVEGKKDRDVFPVGKKFGKFDRITVVVQDSSLELTSFVVTFANGTKFEPEFRQVFNEGTRSRVVELPGDKRIIKDIAVSYNNLPGGGKARIEVYAKNSSK